MEQDQIQEIDSDIFTIRSDHVRIFCFFTEDRRLVLLHGIKKKGTRLRTKDIKKANRMREEFLNNPR
ncbi:type II toxin-antitoxin system RelE/ParE family toxin [Candidatus Palauibacter sp.]|uniref:type II toxin-antitoxin system RelE/ParE family toxin n=1 Tax=Candidatus Palauibacter sp. TaxID=3101350 RepID=UPI003CC5E7DB